jgi:hypothetical protein
MVGLDDVEPTGAERCFQRRVSRDGSLVVSEGLDFHILVSFEISQSRPIAGALLFRNIHYGFS